MEKDYIFRRIVWGKGIVFCYVFIISKEFTKKELGAILTKFLTLLKYFDGNRDSTAIVKRSRRCVQEIGVRNMCMAGVSSTLFPRNKIFHWLMLGLIDRSFCSRWRVVFRFVTIFLLTAYWLTKFFPWILSR